MVANKPREATVVNSVTKYTRPPINEVGISVSLASANLFDPFNVADFHGSLPKKFSTVERADPTPGLDFEQFAGLLPLNAEGRVSRWWFTSADQADVLQVQENFVARNWRRVVTMDEPPSYPGFDTIRASFDECISSMRKWHDVKGSSFPAPRSIELMYDDVLPLSANGSQGLLADTLAYLKVPEHSITSMANWQNAWLEPVDIPGGEDRATLSIQIIVTGVQKTEDVVQPVLRIVWKSAMVL